MRWLGTLAAGLITLSAQGAEAQPMTCELPANNLNVEELIQRTVACAHAGRMLDAGKLWYATAIRLRTIASIDQHPDGTPALMASLQEGLGRPVNEWLGGDVRDWLAAIDWAIAWDQRTDFPDLPQTIKGLDITGGPAKGREAYLVQRKGIASMRASLVKDPAEGYRTRRANGLDVRDPRFDVATGRLRAVP